MIGLPVLQLVSKLLWQRLCLLLVVSPWILQLVPVDVFDVRLTAGSKKACQCFSGAISSLR